MRTLFCFLVVAVFMVTDPGAAQDESAQPAEEGAEIDPEPTEDDGLLA
jgi:hypothetical protein